MNTHFILKSFTLTLCYFISCMAYAKPLFLENIELPEGFHISLYADNIKNARAMTLGEKGTLFVGSRSAGNVYAVIDVPDQGRKVLTLAKNLNMPVGVTFRDGALYVSDLNRILRYDNIENRLENPPSPVVVNEQFPSDTHHGWKFIAFGPDDKLYVPVGAPCNICLKEDKRYASIMRMNADGSDLEIFAHGVRNTVGFDWAPDTNTLWFTDNGRDWMGDNRPPDELNRAPEPGMHFGYPFCHGKDISDPKYGDQRPCSDFTAPEVELGPHVAALGMRFYTGTQFPKKYHNKIFIAEHGSWNRSTPIGYRITMVDPHAPEQGYEVFAQGWLQGQVAWGRPVDVLNMPDGSLLVSDDHGDAIYQIHYDPERG